MKSRVAGLVFAFPVLLFTLLLMACASDSTPLSGRVIDANGMPIANAQVAIGPHELLTDDSGAFQAMLRPANYEMVVLAPGYIESRLGVSLVDGEQPIVQEVTLQPRMISGVVVDASLETPVSGAIVRLGPLEAVTDIEGRFMLPMAETTALQVSCHGCRDASLGPEQVAQALDARGALIAPLQVPVELLTLSGKVTELANGQPITGARVSTEMMDALTDSEGHYLLRGIAIGDLVQVYAQGHRPASPREYDGRDDLDWALEPWQMTLTVHDQATEAPLAGVQIMGARADAITDASGQAIVSLEPGQVITLTLRDYCTETLTYQGEPSVSLALRPSRLVIRLVDGLSRQPVLGGLVQSFEQGATEPRLARTDETGQVELSDAATIDHLFIKAANYARVTVPITRMGVVEIALEPFISKGIYIPFGRLTQPDRILELLKMTDGSVLNTVVVDVKGDASYIAWPSENPLAQEAGAFVPEMMPLEELLRLCRERDIYTIARIVVFKDDLLATTRPQWAIVREDGSFYTDWQGTKWMDPFRQGVRDYNIALAREVAAMGFDEVQYDYVRFPSDGRIKDLVYEQASTFESRVAAISRLLAETYEALAPTPAFFSADIYGLTVWVTDPNCDRKPLCDLGIGQWVEEMAAHVDYISPMLYPDTFAPGSFGFNQPASYPYDVVYRSVIKTLDRTHVPVRAWISHYSPSWLGVTYDVAEYVAQRKAVEDASGHGWLFWNAGGKYNAQVFDPNAYRLIPNLPSPPVKE